MKKFKIFSLIFVFILSPLPSAYAEDNDISCTEIYLKTDKREKPTGGINFEAIETIETEISMNLNASFEPKANTLTIEEYIYQECMKHATEIYLAPYRIHIDDIDDIFYNVATKNPELMVHTGFSYSYYPNSTVVKIVPYYINPTLNDDNTARKLMNEKIDEYIEYASGCPDKIGKLLLIHDKITEDCMYDYTPYVYVKRLNEETGYYEYVKTNDYKAHHAYGVFLNNEAVCQGFSQAIYAICKKLDINADYVISDERYLNHMWNYIEIDGEWYHLDLTWDEVYNTKLDYHDYFLLSDATISQDHRGKSTWTNYSGELKDCTSKKYESNHIFNFPELTHITYSDGKYKLPLKLGAHNAVFESDTLYTGPIITSAPITNTATTGLFFIMPTTSATVTSVAAFSENETMKQINISDRTFTKNTILEFSYNVGKPGRTLSCMFMDLDTLIPYSKKITIN